MMTALKDRPPPSRLPLRAVTIAAVAVLTVAVLATVAAPAQDDPFAGPRAGMVAVIESHTRLARHALGRPELRPKVLAVMGAVPRHAFVPAAVRPLAYTDRPLPIGHGQTISQPFIVALMTDLLQTEAGDVVLEVGTGSGYQAAVLGRLVRDVYTIEIIPPLGERAAKRLGELGFDNVRTRLGDGYYGWEVAAPFDGIIVTAAAGHVPPPLIRQLKPGGRMVIPVGGPFTAQHLMLVDKRPNGEITTRQILPVRFVPLTRR